jgi:hypothetical protein
VNALVVIIVAAIIGGISGAMAAAMMEVYFQRREDNRISEYQYAQEYEQGEETP